MCVLLLAGDGWYAAAQTRKYAVVVEDGRTKAIDTTGRVVADGLPSATCAWDGCAVPSIRVHGSEKFGALLFDLACLQKTHGVRPA